MIEGKTREETIRLTAEALGISLTAAEFIVGQELGDGPASDVIVVDDDGNEIEPDADTDPS